MGKLFNWLSGRTTSFLVGFFIIGNVSHFIGKLDATYISFMVTFVGLVLGHSVKEDVFAAKQPPTP